MPKVIKDLTSTLYREAKKLLLEQGFRDMNIRDLAKNCNIAVGTVYNYYESKEDLVADVMMTDWSAGIDAAKELIAAAESAVDGMEAIYHAAQDFFHGYTQVFRNCSKKAVYIPSVYHEKLLEQIISLEEFLFERFPCSLQPTPYRFLAENILHAVTHGKMDFQDLRPILMRLL